MWTKTLKSLALGTLLSSSIAAPSFANIQDEVFYFVLADRFSNGDLSNDTGGISGGIGDHGFDPSSKTFYHGGDLVGLRDQLDYIEGLGVTALWLAPVFENKPTEFGSSGYHGYWTTDYTRVDPHLGTNEELTDLIADAHSRGIKVFLDVVMNHTADIIKYEECHNPDGSLLPGLTSCDYVDSEQSAYTPFVPAGQETIKAPAWLNDPQYYNNRGESTFAGESSVSGDFPPGLDDLNTLDPAVVQGFYDIFTYWIDEFGIDGYRLDTVKHVDVSFWQQWTPAILEYARANGKPDFHIFGEVFDGNPNTLSYYTTVGDIPSVLDFGMYFPAQRVFAGPSHPNDFLWAMERDDLYTDGNSDANMLMSFVSNHDVGRIGNAIENNFPAASEEEKLARARLANAWMFFARGIPVIYYGDEQGFTGDGVDADSRADMMPSLVAEYNDDNLLGSDATTAQANFDTTHPLYQAISSFSSIYRSVEALNSGTQFLRHAEEATPGILAISRVGADQREVLVMFNNNTEAQTLTLGATAAEYTGVVGSNVVASEGSITVTVPGLDFVILQANTAIAPIAGELSATLSVPSVDGFMTGVVKLDVNVSNQNAAPVVLNDVAFEVRVGEGAWESLGSDKAPAYSVSWNTDHIPLGTQVSIRATVTDQLGQQVVVEESAIIDVPEGMTIRFKKPETWRDANIFFYDSAAPSPSWPGIAMRDHGDDWYSYQFPAGASNGVIIFNDGAGQQTDNLTRTGSGCYTDGEWSADCSLPFYVYFQAPTDGTWGNTSNIHYWNATPAWNTDWPGVEMDSLDEGWFKFKFEDGVESANIIFNNGAGLQSSNLYREGTGCFVAETQTWSDTCTLPVGPFGQTMYVRGSMNDWSDTHALEYVGGGRYEGKVTLHEGYHEFKLANGDWSTQYTNDLESVVSLKKISLLQLIENGGNLNITVPRTAVYTFFVNAKDLAELKLRVMVPKPFGKAPLFIRGSQNDWGTDTQMRYNGDGTYSKTIKLPWMQDNWQFKIASEDWTSADLGSLDGAEFALGDSVPVSMHGANLQLPIVVESKYEVILDAYEGATVSVQRPASEIAYEETIYLVGDYNNWAFDVPLIEESSGRYIQTIALQPGTYNFKIASEGYEAVNLGAAAGEENVKIGKRKFLEASDNNIVLEVDSYKKFQFLLNARKSSENPKLKVFEYEIPKPIETQLFVIGGMNNWQFTDALEWNGESYVADIELDSGSYEFKVADQDWSIGTNYGGHFDTSDNIVEVGIWENLQDQSQSNLIFATDDAGTYRFHLYVDPEQTTEPQLYVNPVVE